MKVSLLQEIRQFGSNGEEFYCLKQILVLDPYIFQYIFDFSQNKIQLWGIISSHVQTPPQKFISPLILSPFLKIWTETSPNQNESFRKFSRKVIWKKKIHSTAEDKRFE